MTLTIKLPPTYDFSTADECAIQMAEAVLALDQRLKAKVEHNLTTAASADHKLHLYRSISAVLDAVLAAMEDRDNSVSSATRAAQAEAAIPPDAARPSTTAPGDTLRCADCGHTATGTTLTTARFFDGLKCPVTSLQADFYACPKCSGIYIVKQEVTDA